MDLSDVCYNHEPDRRWGVTSDLNWGGWEDFPFRKALFFSEKSGGGD